MIHFYSQPLILINPVLATKTWTERKRFSHPEFAISCWCFIAATIRSKGLYVEKRTENIGVYQISKRNEKKAGTGPNRPHIQGSKIAKRLPSVKYSLLQYSKIENFSKKLHTQKMDIVIFSSFSNGVISILCSRLQNCRNLSFQAIVSV